MMKLLLIGANDKPSLVADKINKNLQAIYSTIQSIDGKLSNINGHTSSMPDTDNRNGDHDKRYMKKDDVDALRYQNPVYLGNPNDMDTMRLLQESGILYIQMQSTSGVWDVELWQFSKGEVS
jgi:hypothetical protein